MYVLFYFLQVAKSNCQMWVKFSREGAALQLLGMQIDHNIFLAIKIDYYTVYM